MIDVPGEVVELLQGVLGAADVQRDAAVARYTTWRVGGAAALLVVARDVERLRIAAEIVRDAGLPWLVLGRGSNVLVCDEGVRGVVIVNRADALRIEGTTLWAESGGLLSVLARRTTTAGLEGLEWCHDIPGSVGGAVVNNAGAHGGSISDVLRRVRVLPPWGAAADWDAADLGFGYRRSILREGRPSPPARADWAVDSAEPTAQAAWAGGEGRQLGLALVAGAVTALAYVPWLPALRAFLHRGDRGFGMFSGGGTAGLADLQSSLATFGFSGFALLLLCVGIVVVVIWIGYGRWREGILLLLWPAIPIAGFWVKLHAATLTVTPRYFSFLAPAAVLLAAVGADGIVAATGWMVRRIGSGRWRQLVASVGVAIVALLLLLETVPALAAQYAMPKTDYRDATARIIATGSPNAVVFAVGTCNYFILGPLDYYLWLHHSSIVVVDGGQLDDRVAARLRWGAGPVWDAIITGSGSSGCAVPVDLAHAPTADLAVTSYDEIALLRVRTRRLGAVAQAKTLLRWGSAYQPQLLSSLDLLNVLSSGARIGPNLLPPPSTTGKGRDRWSVPSDARALPDGSGFELGPQGGSMVNVTLTTRHVTAGTHYLLSFSYRNGGLQGEQKVYVSALSPGGQWLSVFPNGAGYSCSPAADPTRGSFALTAPAGATSLIIWLRATGSGVAAFQTVRLQPVG